MADRGMECSGSTNDADDWSKTEDEVTCIVCKELFVEPKTVSCLHTFCERCIQVTHNNPSNNLVGGRRRKCPVLGCCGELPEDVAKVPTNALLERTADIARRRKARTCGGCNENALARMWCFSCEHYLCGQCYKQHQRMTTFKSHKTVTAEHFKSQRPNKVLPVTVAKYKCKKHNEQPMDLYCKTCNTLICGYCILDDHRQHEYDYSSKLADEECDKITTATAPLKTMLKQVGAALNKVEDHDNELNNETNIESLVEEMYHKLHEMLDQCKARDMKKLEDAKAPLQSLIGSQKEDLKLLQGCLLSCDEFVSKATTAGLLPIYSNDICKRVEELTQQVQQTVLEPKCGVHQLILSKANLDDHVSHFTSLCRVSTLPFAPNCSVKGPVAMTKYGLVNITIALKDRSGQHVPGQTEHLRAQFVDRNIISSCSVRIDEDKSKDIYVLSYQTKKRECHKLSVYWKEDLLGEIKVPVKVRDYSTIKKPIQSPITKYGKKDEMDITCPHLMAIGPSNELIVRDCHVKTLVVYDDKLKFSHLISVGEPPPTGLAVSRDGYLYISTDHAVKKLTMDGQLIFTFGTEGSDDGQFKCPRGLCLTSTGLLYVCDKNNHRIQVLKENQFHFSFGSLGSLGGSLKEPYDLVFNTTEDVLFVTDCGNHRIQLFTPTGQFLKLFGNFVEIPGRLRFPTGICYTSDDHVLICSGNSNYMLIFKEDGTFVKDVPIEGVSKEKQAADPVGVVMKSDGRIIVAGCKSNKLIVF